MTINGENIGSKIADKWKMENQEDKGSLISIVATDLPLSSRQLKRICKRTGVGLARLGSFIGHGSGEITIAFSTANTISHKNDEYIVDIKIMNEDRLDLVFRAVAECEEEAVLNSMITAETVIGFEGRTRYSLKEYIDYL